MNDWILEGERSEGKNAMLVSGISLPMVGLASLKKMNISFYLFSYISQS